MRTITLLALLFITIAGILLATQPNLPRTIIESTQNVVEQAETETTNLIAPMSKHISTPEPLRGQLHQPTNTTLTETGVFTATNQRRQQHSLPTLARDATLDQAATNKLQDMFANQYFDHVAPDGTGPGDVVEAAGYTFLTTGENLALGNFPSDNDLVQAWMDSPGHRANILGTQFQEIGIAVGQGTFEGQTTWLAVQTFATPAAACPLPDSSLETRINTNLATQSQLETQLEDSTAHLDSRQAEVSNLKQQIDQLQTEGQQLITQGNAAIEEGNRLAEEGRQEEAKAKWEEGEKLQQQGQAKLEKAKSLVDSYNQQLQELQQLQQEHNQIVNQLQTLHQTLTNQTQTYNQQVRQYNDCADQFSQ